MSKSKPLPEGSRKLEPSELTRLMRENAEALFKSLAGEDFHRAFNPDCPPRRRGRPQADRRGGLAIAKKPDLDPEGAGLLSALKGRLRQPVK